MAVQKLSEEIKQRILTILRQHDVMRAAIFGSFATGTARDESDLDILIEFGSDKSLLDLAGLKVDLEEILDREVDVVTYRGLHPRIRERVLREQVPIL
jgi:predicted nucleotidyltransferase